MSRPENQATVNRINRLSNYYEILQVSPCATSESESESESGPDWADPSWQETHQEADSHEYEKIKNFFILLILSMVVISLGCYIHLKYFYKHYSLQPDSTFCVHKETDTLGVDYYVRDLPFEKLLEMGFVSNMKTLLFNSFNILKPPKDYELEIMVEKEHILNMEVLCSEEVRQRDEMLTRARILDDRELLKKAHYFEMEACDKL